LHRQRGICQFEIRTDLGHASAFFRCRHADVRKALREWNLYLWNAQLAVRVFGDDRDGLAACRRRLLTDVGTSPPRLQAPSAADRWKCGRARRLEQVRRLRANESSGDAADSVLDEMERDVVSAWAGERRAASRRLALAVAALTTAVTYLLVGVACQCRRCRSASPGSAADSEVDAGDNDSTHDVEGRPPRLASSLMKSTSV